MRILLTSVSAGSGHVRAADAIQKALNRHFPSIETRHIDAMDYVPPFFKKFYVGGYSLAANKLPAIWGAMYYGTDKENLPGQKFMNYLQFKLCRKLLQLINEFKPDLIVTTHFLLPQILPFILKEKIFDIPVHCVITDFYAHQFWLNKNVHRYYVAQEKSVEKLVLQGFDRSQVVVSGIPIHQNFSEPVDKRKILPDLNLEPGIPTLLFLSGGLGFGDLVSTVQTIFELENKIQIITVSGKNAKLHAKLRNLKSPSRVKAVHLGFVANMHELLSISDVVVTKGGGLTISECLAKGNALVLYPVIPGQEEKNCRLAEWMGAGIIARNLPEVAKNVKSLLDDSAKLAKMRNNSFTFAKPAAALTIARDSVAGRLSV